MRLWKSPMVYCGSKYTLLKKLIPLLPKKINNFYDAFGGSGTVAINMLIRAEKVHYNELDFQVYNLIKYITNNSFEKVQDKAQHFIRQFKLEKSDDKINIVYFNEFMNYINDHYFPYEIPPTEMGSDYYKNLNIAAVLLIVIQYSFNGNFSFTNKGKISATYGYTTGSDYKMTVAKIKALQSLPLGNLKYSNVDFTDAIKNAKAGDFIYLDPPYYKTNVDYGETWTDDMDDRLFKALDDAHAKGVHFGLSNTYTTIAGEHNDKLKEWAEKYHVHFWDKNYNYMGNVNKKNVEVYITNYEPEEAKEKQITLF